MFNQQLSIDFIELVAVAPESPSFSFCIRLFSELLGHDIFFAPTQCPEIVVVFLHAVCTASNLIQLIFGQFAFESGGLVELLFQIFRQAVNFFPVVLPDS